jgi:hypothetical protein
MCHLYQVFTPFTPQGNALNPSSGRLGRRVSVGRISLKLNGIEFKKIDHIAI